MINNLHNFLRGRPSTSDITITVRSAVHQFDAITAGEKYDLRPRVCRAYYPEPSVIGARHGSLTYNNQVSLLWSAKMNLGRLKKPFRMAPL